MPVITGGWYNKEPLHKHPDWLFLFGDNDQRTGNRGQAAICRGEPNALGIRTKWQPSARPNAFFTDNDYKRCVAMIADDLAPAMGHVKRGGVCVLPLGGIGTGYAQLEDRAPGVFRYLQHALQVLVLTGMDRPAPPPIEITAPQASGMQTLARQSRCVLIWSIYRATAGFPNGYTAVPSGSACMAPMIEYLMDTKLDRLRDRLPGGLSCMPALPEDASTLIETWV